MGTTEVEVDGPEEGPGPTPEVATVPKLTGLVELVGPFRPAELAELVAPVGLAPPVELGGRVELAPPVELGGPGAAPVVAEGLASGVPPGAALVLVPRAPSGGLLVAWAGSPPPVGEDVGSVAAVGSVSGEREGGTPVATPPAAAGADLSPAGGRELAPAGGRELAPAAGRAVADELVGAAEVLAGAVEVEVADGLVGPVVVAGWNLAAAALGVGWVGGGPWSRLASRAFSSAI